MTDELGKFCDACQAIPMVGYCGLAGCPMVPARQTAWENLANSQRQLDADGCEVGVSRQAIDETLAELKRCYEVIGAYAVAEAYADTFPDDEADATDMKFGQHYWEGAASLWAGDDLLDRAHEAAKERMRKENPAQVRDLDWSRAMEDVVASGGIGGDNLSTAEMEAAFEAWAGPMPSSTPQSDREGLATIIDPEALG